MTPKVQEPKYKIGLDIGSYAVKMMEIAQTPEQTALKCLGMRKIVGLSKEEISGTIRSLAEEIKVSVKEAAISVSGQSVIVRFISMPRMREDELKAAIRFEAEKFIPFNINDCVFDFQVLTKDSAAAGKNKNVNPAKTDDNKLNILLSVAKKDHVQAKVEVAERAGFGVRVVDVDSFALANAFVKNFTSSGPDKISALVNVGARSTNLSILRDNLIVFVRDPAMGSDDFNDAIAKGCGVDIGSVEEIKASGAEKAGKLIDCIKPVLTQLLDDIKLSFEYYENQSGRGIDDIYISGGGAGLPGLDDAMQEAFGVKPNRWDPLSSLVKAEGGPDTGSIDKMKDYFCVATGLALR